MFEVKKSAFTQIFVHGNTTQNMLLFNTKVQLLLSRDKFNDTASV